MHSKDKVDGAPRRAVQLATASSGRIFCSLRRSKVSHILLSSSLLRLSEQKSLAAWLSALMFPEDALSIAGLVCPRRLTCRRWYCSPSADDSKCVICSCTDSLM